MSEWWSRIAILLAMAFVLGVPFAFHMLGDHAAGPVEETVGRLVIYSPHNEQIRYEFSRAFNAHRIEQGNPPIEFDWRSSGGTSDLRRQVSDFFQRRAREALEQHTGHVPGIEADLFFGGGAYDHDQLARRLRVTVPMNVDDLRVVDPALAQLWQSNDVKLLIEVGRTYNLDDNWFLGWTQAGVEVIVEVDVTHSQTDARIAAWRDAGLRVSFVDKARQQAPLLVSRAAEYTMAAPLEIDDAALATIFPEPTIAGEPMIHPDRLWVGAALSSFGIVYNRDMVRHLGMEHEPQTWDDMADERYFGWIALADPGHSGSIAATYEAILRRKGWTEGWASLRRIFANARYFTAAASKVPVDVAQGEAAAGMCIDFYGRFQAGAIGGDRVDYVDPRYMTATTADPITILHGAPNAQLAREFVLWVLSKDGQQLWQQKLDTPGGPDRFELRRLPIRRDVYTPEAMADWTDDVNPFDIARPMPAAMPGLFRFVAPVCHAMAIDIHDDLKAAWEAIIREKDPAVRASMLELFDRMPAELTLTWPDAHLAANWATIIDQPDHPRYAQVASTLKTFTDNLAKRWRDQDGVSGKDRLLDDRLRWTGEFRENYRQIVAMSTR